MADVKRRREWLPDIVDSRILEGDVESRIVIWERFHLPWPLSDRDCVVESTIHKDYANHAVTVDFHEVEHPAMPPVPGLVRVAAVRGRMAFRSVDDGHTAASYEAALDAGRTLRVLERRTQAADHPILLTVPETLYLKCLILETVA